MVKYLLFFCFLPRLFSTLFFTSTTCQQQWLSCIRKHGCALEPTALVSQTTRTASPMVSASPTGLRMSMGTTSRSEPFRHSRTFHISMLPMHMLLSCQTPLPMQMPAQSLWPARTRHDNPDVYPSPFPFPSPPWNAPSHSPCIFEHRQQRATTCHSQDSQQCKLTSCIAKAAGRRSQP